VLQPIFIMAYTVLARKYRSTNFDELVGQGHVAETLKRAIQSGRIAHAYLFCGTRGTGKTSTARIMAKSLNCQKFDAPTPNPCGVCDSCQSIARGDDIDVIEIDAASNTGVDNVREIIENSQYRPARSRFKVYIIDEVHMLSKSAFNALLKTLEEPPSHVKFILATTEPEKVLPTILSRCQRYDFRSISSKEIAGHLKEICKKEKISADADALALVAKAGAGSMRDALSLLDRLLSLGEQKLTVQSIEEMLGLPRGQRLMELAQAIGSGDVKSALTQADGMITSGLSVDAMVGAISDYFRNLLIARTCGADSELLDVPGVSESEIAAQADKFPSVALAQDIAILEELRRNLRFNQTGRAMLDAALVRLTLSEQFGPIRDLMPGAPAPVEQKKNAEPVGRSANGVGPVSRLSDEPTPALADPPGKSPAPTSASPAAEDEDDDLPRPGKVWDGPSLKDLLKQQSVSQSATPAAAVPVSATASSTPASPDSVNSASSEPTVGPIGDSDTARLWPALLALLERQTSAMSSVLSMATFGGIEEGIAVIRFPHSCETFAKQYSANGKREKIAQALTELRGQPTGVRFEVAPADAGDAQSTAVMAPRAAAAVSKEAVPQRESLAAVPQAPRMTAEMRAEAEADPIVRLILQEFGGTVKSVEDIGKP
jgi:DNA polymerase-3 subunit gamma/tau